MKVLFELPLKIQDFRRSQINWLNKDKNWLFVIEDEKVLRIFTSDAQDPGKEFHTTNLRDTRRCTCLSWNRDYSKLALVLDRRHIYLWDTLGEFRQFIPSQRSVSSNMTAKRFKEINLIAWSKLSNKFLFCYLSAQIIICDGDDFSEKLIDRTSGVMEQIVCVECCSEIDIFACITIKSEILVMDFNGDIKFYLHKGSDIHIIRAKFSFSTQKDETSFDQEDVEEEEEEEEEEEKAHMNRLNSKADLKKRIIRLCYLSEGGKLSFNKLLLGKRPNNGTEKSDDVDLVERHLGSRLIDFDWLSVNRLIAYFSSGNIVLLELKNGNTYQPEFSYTERLLLNIRQDEELLSATNENNNNLDEFKSFKLMVKARKQGDSSNERNFALAAITKYRLFYYELFELNNKGRYVFEKVDHLDLTSSLQKLELEVERIDWSLNCTKLAVQMTNAHLLIYQTKLDNYMVTSHGSKTGYMSSLNEVTILDYGSRKSNPSSPANNNDKEGDGGSIGSSGSNEHALTINIDYEPSLIVVGPKHLAVCLNNRVRFYSIEKSNQNNNNNNNNTRHEFIGEEEYVSIVVALSICSRFVAVNFTDGRVKLHSINFNEKLITTKSDRNSNFNYKRRDNYNDFDERFFPDPSKPETITAFALTESTFLYCTSELCLRVFCLKSWLIKQNYQYSNLLNNNQPIIKLKPNERGNKFVCLTKELRDERVNNGFLYDLYTNKMIKFCQGGGGGEESLCSKMLKSQLYIQLPTVSNDNNNNDDKILMEMLSPPPAAKLNKLNDAIWDTNGRSLLLIERRFFHNMIVLDRTLDSEEPMVIFVATLEKPSSFTILYASHGIVSFQTSLGRVINTIISTHDDESNLTDLEFQIHEILTGGDGDEEKSSSSPRTSEEKQLIILRHKLAFFQTIMPLYSLSKCRDICEHLMSEEQYNVKGEERILELDKVVWRQLAAWSLFTMNLNFALLLYRKHALLPSACALNDIVRDASTRGLDARLSIRTRLLILLNCDA